MCPKSAHFISPLPRAAARNSLTLPTYPFIPLVRLFLGSFEIIFYRYINCWRVDYI